MTDVGIGTGFDFESAGVPFPRPKVTGAVVIDSFTFHVTFDQEMKHVSASNPDDALNPSNYSISVTNGVPLLIQSVSYVSGSGGKKFEIKTTEQTSDALYTVYVNNAESVAHGMVVDPNNNSAAFTGFGERPSVESATADSATQITVIFDELMTHDTALETGSNYNISGPTTVTVNSVVATDDTNKTSCACQLAGEMTTGATYTVEISNVRDLAGNVILGPPDNQAFFTGIGDNPRLNSTATVVPGGHECKIVFSELMGSSALDKDNYTIVGSSEGPLNFQEKDPGSGIYIENVDDEFTYALYTERQAPGEQYTITVLPDAIFDLYNNPVTAPYNEATFTGAGFSPPDVSMNPDDGSTDIEVRRKLLITAKDPTEEFTGINTNTWWTRLSFLREGTSNETIQYAIKDGQIQAGFEGGVYEGDPMDPDKGLTLWIRPLSGKWQELTTYKVETYVEDKEQVPNQNLLIGTFRTGAATCFEDKASDPTDTDLLLMNQLPYSNCEELRNILMRAATTSGSNLVGVRTIMHLACATDLKTILAGRFDFALVEEIKLCDRLPVLDVYREVTKHSKTIGAALEELPLTSAGKNLIQQQLRSNSAVYVVSAVALIVLLCALLSTE